MLYTPVSKERFCTFRHSASSAAATVATSALIVVAKCHWRSHSRHCRWHHSFDFVWNASHLAAPICWKEKPTGASACSETRVPTWCVIESFKRNLFATSLAHLLPHFLDLCTIRLLPLWWYCAQSFDLQIPLNMCVDGLFVVPPFFFFWCLTWLAPFIHFRLARWHLWFNYFVIVVSLAISKQSKIQGECFRYAEVGVALGGNFANSCDDKLMQSISTSWRMWNRFWSQVLAKNL